MEDSSSKEWAEDGLLKWGNDMGVDSHVHQSILNGIGVFRKGEVGTCDLHFTVNDGGSVFAATVWGGKDVGQLSFHLFVNLPVYETKVMDISKYPRVP
jgi:hypothetical protein